MVKSIGCLFEHRVLLLVCLLTKEQTIDWLDQQRDVSDILGFLFPAYLRLEPQCLTQNLSALLAPIGAIGCVYIPLLTIVVIGL
jgi:hypothetical protein